METLSALKRKLKIGQGLKLVKYKDALVSNNNKLNVERFIIKTQGNGVYLNQDKTALKGSFLEFPKASLFESTEKGFKIFEAGLRDLNETEKEVLNNIPKDDKQAEIDILTDGSVMFYREKEYFKEKGFEYLFGGNSTTIRGLYFDTNNNKIRDDSLKGNVILEYEFI
jgi:Icc-related predicted phosphoesterase